MAVLAPMPREMVNAAQAGESWAFPQLACGIAKILQQHLVLKCSLGTTAARPPSKKRCNSGERW